MGAMKVCVRDFPPWLIGVYGTLWQAPGISTISSIQWRNFTFSPSLHSAAVEEAFRAVMIWLSAHLLTVWARQDHQVGCIVLVRAMYAVRRVNGEEHARLGGHRSIHVMEKAPRHKVAADFA
jgi:hypothetical protein